MSAPRIVRFVQRESRLRNKKDSLDKTRDDLLSCCRKSTPKATILQTAGGCLQQHSDMRRYSCGTETTGEHYRKITVTAEQQAMDFLATRQLAKALTNACHYLTLGVDVHHIDDTCNTHVELVGVYDTKRQQFIRWTGKSYPVQFQVASLMYCRDFKSHFILLNGLSVMVLGCHDLNIFSERARASASRALRPTYKATVRVEMDRLVLRHRPEVVLHHPHHTDTPNIWKVPWAGVRKNIPSCRTYSSGISYGRGDKRKVCRGQLEDVLSATAIGNVEDWIQDSE